MSDGIQFHEGTSQIKLNMEVINNSVNFSDDSEEYFKKHERQQEFLRNFIDDTTKFEKKVLKNTKECYDRSIKELIEYLNIENEKNIEKTTNFQSSSVFFPLEAFATLRTALVQCNFTDISRFINDLTIELFNEDEINSKVTEIIVISQNDAINIVIDKILKSTSDRLVLIVQQFESLRPKFLDSIISLIFSTQSICSKMLNIRLVVCISTSPAFFNTTCSVDSINLLNLKEFNCIQLSEIFQKFMETDISPAIYSGSFINYLKQHFFACDYSISALVKAVQFSFLEKYIEDPLWKTKKVPDELKKYNLFFDFFVDFLHENKLEKLQIHADIQCEQDFWKNQNKPVFLHWRNLIFNSKLTDLQKHLDRIIDELLINYDSLKLIVEQLKVKCSEAKSEKAEENVPTPSKKLQKTTFLELKKQQTAIFSSNQNILIRKVREEIFESIMNIFKSVLKPYPSTWPNIIGLHCKIGKFTKVSLYASDEMDIEKVLLDDPKYAKKPAAIAWRTLLLHKNFKTVPLDEWFNEFAKHTKGSNQQKEQFFSAIGQLEHMGMIRGSADRKSTNVNVLYHPISYVANL